MIRFLHRSIAIREYRLAQMRKEIRMKPFRTTSSVSKSNRPTTRTAFLLAVLLIPVVPFRSVKANLLPPSNLTLTIQIIENGAVYTEPVKLWLR